MIFATVGTQLPFDRLLLALDTWAVLNPKFPIFAQTGPSESPFQNIQTTRNLSQTDFRERAKSAQLIVSHAGIGTILTATELEKPIIILPRLAKLGEHRTDHQLHTAREIERFKNVTVVHDQDTLWHALSRAVESHFYFENGRTSGNSAALNNLIDTVREFVFGPEDSGSELVAAQVSR